MMNWTIEEEAVFCRDPARESVVTHPVDPPVEALPEGRQQGRSCS